MKCYNCGELKTKTIYPTYIQYRVLKPQKFVQKLCLTCGWKSSPVQIPEVIR